MFSAKLYDLLDSQFLIDQFVPSTMYARPGVRFSILDKQFTRMMIQDKRWALEIAEPDLIEEEVQFNLKNKFSGNSNSDLSGIDFMHLKKEKFFSAFGCFNQYCYVKCKFKGQSYRLGSILNVHQQFVGKQQKLTTTLFLGLQQESLLKDFTFGYSITFLNNASESGKISYSAGCFGAFSDEFFSPSSFRHQFQQSFYLREQRVLDDVYGYLNPNLITFSQALNNMIAQKQYGTEKIVLFERITHRLKESPFNQRINGNEDMFVEWSPHLDVSFAKMQAHNPEFDYANQKLGLDPIVDIQMIRHYYMHSKTAYKVDEFCASFVQDKNAKFSISRGPNDIGACLVCGEEISQEFNCC